MGKRVKLRKEQKLQTELKEKTLMQQRRRLRLAPIVSYVKRVTLALIATALILGIGVLVNNHIGDILVKLRDGGS